MISEQSSPPPPFQEFELRAVVKHIIIVFELFGELINCSLRKGSSGATFLKFCKNPIAPSINKERLAWLRRFLNARTEKKVTTEILAELAETNLENNIFQVKENILKHLNGTASALPVPYSIQFYLRLTLRK